MLPKHTLKLLTHHGKARVVAHDIVAIIELVNDTEGKTALLLSTGDTLKVSENFEHVSNYYDYFKNFGEPESNYAAF